MSKSNMSQRKSQPSPARKSHPSPSKKAPTPTEGKSQATATGMVNSAQQTASKAANSTWVNKLARLGYATKGVVYLIIGVLAAEAAVGSGGKTTDPNGAIHTIYAQPFGKFLLTIVALGLFGYALWSLIRAIMDMDNAGNDPKGIITRLGYAIAGFSYGTLAVAAFQIVTKTGSGGKSSDAVNQDWTARLLENPLGVALLVLIGLVVIGAAFAQFYRAYKANFDEGLDMMAMSARLKEWVPRLGRFGLSARGVVFGEIGFFLIVAAFRHNAHEAKGIGGALQALTRQPYGQVLLGVVAIGFAAYGVFSLIEARYRRFGRA